MYKEIIKIEGRGKGPTSIILAGVHGNEKCGVKAFDNILPDLKIEKGEVFFGYGNPKAIKENKRCIDSDLNRMFYEKGLSTKDKESYEYNRAQFLKKYLDKSEALLDIHASRTKKSKPFAICESNAKSIIKYLPINFIVSGFDKIEPGGTDYYMNKTGNIGICLESGYFKDLKSKEKAEKGILNFLRVRGHISGKLKERNQNYFKACYIYKTKTDDFKLEKNFKDFEKVEKDQIIGIDGGNKVRADEDSVILFARNENRFNEEAFLLAKRICNKT